MVAVTVELFAATDGRTDRRPSHFIIRLSLCCLDLKGNEVHYFPFLGVFF